MNSDLCLFRKKDTGSSNSNIAFGEGKDSEVG